MDATTWLSLASTLFVGAGVFYAHRSVAQAKALWEQTSRPFVLVDFEIEDAMIVNLTIENIGKSLARDVRITFTPDLVPSVPNRSISRSSALRDGIPSLPPGKRLRIFFDTFPHESGDRPRSYVARVAYKGPRLEDLPEDEYPLDLASLEGTLSNPRSLAKSFEELLTFLRNREAREQALGVARKIFDQPDDPGAAEVIDRPEPN